MDKDLLWEELTNIADDEARLENPRESCVCGQEYGLVWDAPGHRNAWVHFACTNISICR